MMPTGAINDHGPLARYIKLSVVHVQGMLGTFSLPPRVSDPNMHHGTCMTHMPCCMPGSLTSSFLWSLWQGKRSRHSQRMRNPQFYIFGKNILNFVPKGPMKHYLNQWWLVHWNIYASLGLNELNGTGVVAWLRRCQWKNPQGLQMNIVLHLTDLPLVPHIWVSELGQHWFR